MHRKECARYRARRIELRRNGFCGLRECRTFEFHLLACFISQALQNSVEFVETCGESNSLKRLAYFVDISQMPAAEYASDAGEICTWLKERYGDEVFDDRCRGLFQQYEEDDDQCIQLAFSTARFGEYDLLTMVTFLVRGPHPQPDGKEEFQVDFLNWCVKILDRPNSRASIA